jgi:hypothetical protein
MLAGLGGVRAALASAATCIKGNKLTMTKSPQLMEIGYRVRPVFSSSSQARLRSYYLGNCQYLAPK